MVMPASHYCRLPLSALFLAQFSLVEHTEQYVPKVAAKAIPLTYKRSYPIVVKSDIYVDLKQIGTKVNNFYVKRLIPELFFIPLSIHYSISNLMKRIILITGGQRSGKSSFAEIKRMNLLRHRFTWPLPGYGTKNSEKGWNAIKKNRGPEWINIEEEKEIEPSQCSGQSRSDRLCNSLVH